MSEEWFDIVTDKDEVIGKAPRSEVHQRRLRHRAVHILIFNDRDELFLQQRSFAKDDFSGAWDSSSSGHVTAGEDYDSTSLREVEEELGVRLNEIPERVHRMEASEETAWEFCWVYRAIHEGPFVLQASEIRGGGWFTPEALIDWMNRRPEDFSSAFRRIWRERKQWSPQPLPAETVTA